MKIYIKITIGGLEPDCKLTKIYAEAHNMRYLSNNALLYLMNEHDIIISNNRINNIISEYMNIKGINKKEAAKIFNVTALTIANWEKNKKIPKRALSIIEKEYPLIINPAITAQYNDDDFNII